jgi:hypothetical protein
MKGTRKHPLAVFLAAAAVLVLAACSGGSGTPEVASLGTGASLGTRASLGTGGGGTGGASAPATQPTGNPTRLLNEWAACMRSHGDPGQADPTVDADKVIHVVMLPSVQGGPTGYIVSPGQGGTGPGLSCDTYLTAAETALRGSLPAIQLPSQAQFLKFAECMRASGVPDFPDPAADGFQFSGPPDDPALQYAASTCATKTGVRFPGVSQAPPGSVIQEDPGGLQRTIIIPVSSGNG